MIIFHLNGRETVYDGDENRSLLDVLRLDHRLTGPKDGCSGQAACGACLVEMDGRPALACSVLMKKAAGKSVATIDGFPEPVRRILGRAFVARAAVQCGFCSPGMVTRAKILLEQNPDPSRVQVAQALRGHLCRCTGYVKIVDAVLLAARAIREGTDIPWDEDAGVGRSGPKYQAYEKALGAHLFVADQTRPGLLFGALRFSDHPRARILKIDPDPAEAMPGVVRVFTARDIPGQRFQGLIVPDWPMMAAVGETTRCIGDVLALVVAESEALARRAAGDIRVEYDVLEPVTDLDQAAANVVRVHQAGNVLKETVVRRGDPIRDVLARSAFVARGVFETPFVEHAFLETEAALAEPGPDGGLVLHSQSQGIFKDRAQIASILGLEENRVRVIQEAAGGAFGGKEDLSVQHHAALAAFHLNRPVLVRLSRPESIRMHPKRHRMRLDYALGCDIEGRLTGLFARIVGDTGAYASVGGEVVARSGTHAAGAYFVPHVDVVATALYTNHPPAGAFRGFGVNQATFAMESLVEDLCRQGGFDSFDFRRQNALAEGLATTTGQVLGPGVGLKECLDAVKADYDRARYRGLALAIKNVGIGNGLEERSRVLLRVEPDGRLRLIHGWSEMGQGIHTVALQMIRETLGPASEAIPMDIESQTGRETLGGVTTASRGTVLLGLSVLDAARKLKSDLETTPLTDLAGREYLGEYGVDWTTRPGSPGPVISHFSYGFSAQLVILDDQGRIETVVAAHDGGRIVHPALFEGQVEGGVAMGLGYALGEQLLFENGRLKTDRLGRLGLLRAPDMPSIKVILVECPDPIGPFGAKGVGEIGSIPTAPAAANAFRSFDGLRRDRLPLSPIPGRKPEPAKGDGP